MAQIYIHYDTLKTLNAPNKQPSLETVNVAVEIIESKLQKGRKTKSFPLAILSSSLF